MARAWSISESEMTYVNISSSAVKKQTNKQTEPRTSDVVVGHGDLRDDVGAFREPGLDEALVLLQRFFDHLQLGVHVGHEEVFDPTLR